MTIDKQETSHCQVHIYSTNWKRQKAVAYGYENTEVTKNATWQVDNLSANGTGVM